MEEKLMQIMKSESLFNKQVLYALMLVWKDDW